MLIKGINSVESGEIDYKNFLKKEKPVEVPVVEEEVLENAVPAYEGHDSKTWYGELFRKTKEWFETEEDAEF